LERLSDGNKLGNYVEAVVLTATGGVLHSKTNSLLFREQVTNYF